jgi:hypothetical protein
MDEQTNQIPSPRRWLAAFLTAIAVLYAPFGWLLVIDYPWDHYHFYWLKMWCILPGLLAGLPFHNHDEPLVEFCIMGVATLVLIGLLTLMGSASRAWLVAESTVGLIFAIGTSAVAYRLFYW